MNVKHFGEGNIQYTGYMKREKKHEDSLLTDGLREAQKNRCSEKVCFCGADHSMITKLKPLLRLSEQHIINQRN